jgi:hypothetical protein
VTPDQREFDATFARWARRVRGRLALRGALGGAAFGLVVGVVGAGAAWFSGHGALRPWMAGSAVLGGALGLALARRKRLGDEEVALYLDARLGSAEAIATALDRGSAGGPGHFTVVTQATKALDHATDRAIRPTLFRAFHGVGPVALAGILFVSLSPLPAIKAPPPTPPGAGLVRLADVSALDKTIHLGDLSGRNPSQDKRLNELSEDAKKLQAKLQSGVEKREALADLAKLRDAVTAERLSLGNGEERAGLESAMDKLGHHPKLGSAAKALGDRDLTELDDEMRKLANTLEQGDREAAREALEKAARAAQEAGAPEVAKALEEQKRLLAERGKRSDHLKELARALGDGLPSDAKESLDKLGKGGSHKDEQKLAEALEKALDAMSDEERKRLADQLKKQLGDDDGSGMESPSKRELRELAKSLDTPEGQRKLADALKQMAKEPGEASGESARQKALDEALQGTDELGQSLGGGVPMPIAGSDAAKGQGNPGGNPTAGKDDGSGQPGPGRGGGPGSHKGQTGVVDGQGVRAKAEARMNPGRSMPGRMLGRTTGRAGETADTIGRSGLEIVGPDEVGSIERSRVPEEYREQVGRYFEPD